MNNQNKKDDVEGKPQSAVRDPKDKQGQLEQHPREGRSRPESTQNEVKDPTENKTSQEKVRREQGLKKSNTN